MPGAALIFGFLAGLDNLQACTAIGACTMKRTRLLWLTAMFSACEVLSSVGGLVLGRAMLTLAGRTGDMIGPFLMLFCGALVVAGGVRPNGLLSGGLFMFLPLSLSADNLVAGAACGAMGRSLEAGLIIGATGALMSCLGLYAGARLRRLGPSRMEPIAGLWLCLLAFRLWC